MRTLFTAEVTNEGGRSGTLQTPFALLDVTLGNPLENTGAKSGPNPEMLFAGAYSACYHGTLSNAVQKMLGITLEKSTIRPLAGLMEDDDDGYHLSVELHAELPGIDKSEAQRIMEEAHQTCPYSKALRGDTCVKLVLD